MLKPPDQDSGLPPQDEPTVGELVHQLVEDGKAYARAEFEVARGKDEPDTVATVAQIYEAGLTGLLAKLSP